MTLQFCKQNLSNNVVLLSLLPLLCNHGNLTLELYISEKIAILMKGDFLYVDSKLEVYQE